jgi:hypothetical protein
MLHVISAKPGPSICCRAVLSECSDQFVPLLFIANFRQPISGKRDNLISSAFWPKSPARSRMAHSSQQEYERKNQGLLTLVSCLRNKCQQALDQKETEKQRLTSESGSGTNWRVRRVRCKRVPPIAKERSCSGAGDLGGPQEEGEPLIIYQV